jgi:hypothetical protein
MRTLIFKLRIPGSWVKARYPVFKLCLARLEKDEAAKQALHGSQASIVKTRNCLKHAI